MIGILAIAAQLSIVAHAPDTVQTCDAIELSVAVSGPGTASQVPRLSAPSFAPFDVLRSSPMPRVSYSAASWAMLDHFCCSAVMVSWADFSAPSCWSTPYRIERAAILPSSKPGVCWWSSRWASSVAT